MRLRSLAPGLLLVLLNAVPLVAQIQHPGWPLGDPGKLKAADVLYVLPPVDDREVEALTQETDRRLKKSLTFALERDVCLSPEFHGAWEQRDGHRIWRVHLISPGAYSLGLFCSAYELAEGAKLFVYDPGMNTVKGAFTRENNKSFGTLAIGHVPGDELVVELQVPSDLADYGRLVLGSLSHAFLPVALPSAGKDGRFGQAHDCNIDIPCPPGDPWWLTKQSVVRIFIDSGTKREYCTGVLINNSNYDGAPFVLTAQHCIATELHANNSVFVFNYERDGCEGGDGTVDMSVSGAELVAVGDSVDFSLVRLTSAIPEAYDPYFAGWDLRESQTAGSTVIHHPMGDVKKIGHDLDLISQPAGLSDVPNSNLRDYRYQSFWWVKRWDWGITEGGSSGAPLFNAQRRVIGTLTGGLAACLDSVGYDEDLGHAIYNTVEDDFFTKTASAFDYYSAPEASLKSWLDPQNTGVRVLDGYHPSSAEPGPPAAREGFRVYPNPARARSVCSAGFPDPGRGDVPGVRPRGCPAPAGGVAGRCGRGGMRRRWPRILCAGFVVDGRNGPASVCGGTMSMGRRWIIGLLLVPVSCRPENPGTGSPGTDGDNRYAVGFDLNPATGSPGPCPQPGRGRVPGNSPTFFASPVGWCPTVWPACR
ncbi:MAG: trypsin-like peptidase domain-containing protein [Bacteroidales bacterium]